MPKGEVVIDPFTGQSLSREELDELLRALPPRSAGLPGDFDVPLALFLQAAAPRDIIARMLRNLKEIHRSSEDWRAPARRAATAWSCCCPRPGTSGATAASRMPRSAHATPRRRRPCRPTSSTLRRRGDRAPIAERLAELGHGDPSRLH